MSYDALEQSLADGRPVRFYEFSQAGRVWRYTSANRNIDHELTHWTNIQISDDGFRQTGETSADDAKITVPADLEVLLQYRLYPPSQRIWLTVYDMHYGDTQMVAVWTGSIVNVNRRRLDAQITCRSIAQDLDTTGLRLTWSPNCVYSIYDHNCKLRPADFRVTATIGALDRVAIAALELATKPDGWFSGGFISWTASDGLQEQRGIDIHKGDTVILRCGTERLAVGQVVQAHAGCLLTKAACIEKGNYDNYGGAPGMPDTSPFDGNPVF